MNISKVFAIVAIALLGSAAANSQTARERDYRIVFEEIQDGFERGNVTLFSAHLAPQVQVNLKGEESGYYSANHAHYVLENYLKSRKVLSFEFTSVGETETMPYGIGRAVFGAKGNREVQQVYVALMKSDGRWAVAEINIY